MALRLRLEFVVELVTDDMNQLGLQKCWYEPLETTATIGELASELVQRFCLEVDSEGDLQLSSDGFTLPQSGRLSLLRDGDLVTVNVCVKQHNAETSGGLELDGDNKRGWQDDVKKRCFVCYQKYGKDVQVFLSKMREHVGAHVLWGDTDSAACGFCGQVGTCSSYLDKGTGKGILKPVSTCPYYYKFSNKAVHKSDKKTARCTNAPMLCTLCPTPTYLWKYDMQKHWQTVHPNELSHFPSDFILCEEEVDNIKRRLKRKKLDSAPGAAPSTGALHQSASAMDTTSSQAVSYDPSGSHPSHPSHPLSLQLPHTMVPNPPTHPASGNNLSGGLAHTMLPLPGPLPGLPPGALALGMTPMVMPPGIMPMVPQQPQMQPQHTS